MQRLFNGRVRLFISAILLFMIMFSTGCVKKNSDDNNSGIYGSLTDTTQKSGGVISLFTTDIDSLNPLISKNFYMSSFLNLIYEGLVMTDENFEIKPALADSWSSRNQNKSWIFKIKTRVKWHNSTTFKVEDIIQTSKYILSSSYNGNFKNSLNGVLSIKKVDKARVLFTLSKPDPLFYTKMIFPIFPESKVSSGEISKNLTPVGTGPFRFKSYKDNLIILDRNTHYYLKQAYLKSIKLKVFKSPSEALGGFLRGEIDVYPTSDYAAIENIRKGYNSFDSNMNKSDLILINNQDKILKSPLVRKALSLLLSRDSIVQNSLYGNLTSSYLPNLFSDHYLNLFPYNPVEAQTNLNRAGWNPSTKLEMIINSENKSRMQIANQIKKKLETRNVKLNIKSLPFDQFNSLIQTGDFQMALAGFETPSDGDFRYYLKFCGNTAFNSLINSWEVETDSSKRYDFYKQIISKFSIETPVIGLYNYKTFILCSRRIIGTLSSNSRFPYNGLASCSVSY